jgi:methionyl-tRNA synthetase
MSGKNKKLVITSALPYVNNTPHLGNVVGCVLSADVYARYTRTVKGRDVLFIGGVDEYGTATEMKARELGISCKELCDQNYAIHKKSYDWFNIQFDCYGRTSQPNGNPYEVDCDWPHTNITREIYTNLVKNKSIVEQKEIVWYCKEINECVADRYIISTCYHCGSEKADGDQCDSCGKLLSTYKLINPKYKPNPDYVLESVTTTNLYIDLPNIWTEHKMEDWFDKNKQSWSNTARSITESWLENGLKSRSVTRDLKWGTRVPDTDKYSDKYTDKVFYVWFDAPIGYLSIMENVIGRNSSLKWWNTDSEIVQFMAKDNVPFHSIVFPLTLAANKKRHNTEYKDNIEYNNYGLPDIVKIASTDYLMYEGGKFSKSKNLGLFCDDVIKISTDLNIDSDLWRAYLIYIRPETNDSNFVLNESGFVDFVNSILIGNLGNMTHRIRSIVVQYNKKHGEMTECKDNDSELLLNFNNKCDELYLKFIKQMDEIKLREAFKTLLSISSECNVLINQIEPWKYVKLDKENIAPIFYEFIFVIYESISKIGRYIEPFMPNTGKQIQLDFEVISCPNKPMPMFSRLENIDLTKYK